MSDVSTLSDLLAYLFYYVGFRFPCTCCNKLDSGLPGPKSTDSKIAYASSSSACVDSAPAPRVVDSASTAAGLPTAAVGTTGSGAGTYSSGGGCVFKY